MTDECARTGEASACAAHAGHACPARRPGSPHSPAAAPAWPRLASAINPHPVCRPHLPRNSGLAPWSQGAPRGERAGRVREALAHESRLARQDLQLSQAPGEGRERRGPGVPADWGRAPGLLGPSSWDPQGGASALSLRVNVRLLHRYTPSGVEPNVGPLGPGEVTLRLTMTPLRGAQHLACQ